MFLFRGVVELLRALADGVEWGLSVISPLDIPPQPEEEASPAGTGSASAAGSGDEVPAGVGPPTAPAGHPETSAASVDVDRCGAFAEGAADPEVEELARKIYALGWVEGLHNHTEEFDDHGSAGPLLRVAERLLAAGFRKNGSPDAAICEIAAQQLRRQEWASKRTAAYWNWIADELTTK